MTSRGGVLGLDLAAAWGWALIGGQRKLVDSGHRAFTLHYPIATRCLKLGAAIADLAAQFEPAAIVIEKPISTRTTSYWTLRALMSFATKAEEIAIARQIRFFELPRSSCCLHLLGQGHGNAKKPESLAWVQEHWSGKVTSFDEADAVLVALTGFDKFHAPLPGADAPVVKPKRRRKAASAAC
jgi:Holliday junction resolvasome RuvABC endonuclease subunit